MIDSFRSTRQREVFSATQSIHETINAALMLDELMDED
jgi:hypothetical protein